MPLDPSHDAHVKALRQRQNSWCLSTTLPHIEELSLRDNLRRDGFEDGDSHLFGCRRLTAGGVEIGHFTSTQIWKKVYGVNFGQGVYGPIAAVRCAHCGSPLTTDYRCTRCGTPHAGGIALVPVGTGLIGRHFARRAA